MIGIAISSDVLHYCGLLQTITCLDYVVDAGTKLQRDIMLNAHMIIKISLTELKQRVNH